MKFFLSIPLWKKIWVILFASAGIKGMLTDPPSSDIVNTTIGLLIFLLITIAPLIPEYLYFISTPEKLWKKWANEFVNADAKRRIKRAEDLELMPLKIDVVAKKAVFEPIGYSKGIYKTTLKKCSCPDFQKRHRPCKHMYFLADQCGIDVKAE